MAIHAMSEVKSFTYVAVVTTLAEQGINNIANQAIHVLLYVKCNARVGKVNLVDLHDFRASFTTTVATFGDHRPIPIQR